MKPRQMDLTEGSVKQKTERSKKMMVVVLLFSLFMGFAGLTSAYLVSQKREDWMSSIQLPDAFLYGLLIIALSSVTYILAGRFLKANDGQKTLLLLGITLVLGVAFIFIQFEGFKSLIQDGNYLTGDTANIKSSFIYVIAVAHIVHVVAGLISLGWVTVNQYLGKYTSERHLGFSLGAIFWHFLGGLWLYLYLFMYFFQ